jgi:hypothetical protein
LGLEESFNGIYFGHAFSICYYWKEGMQKF